MHILFSFVDKFICLLHFYIHLCFSYENKVSLQYYIYLQLINY